MISTAWYMIVFRTVHILAGVVWVGSVFLLVMFVQPSVAAIAPAGAPFTAELLGKRRLIDRIIGMGVVTIVAGLFLYWHDWHLYASFGDWLGSGFGASLTIGMLAAIAALVIGISVTRPSLVRLLELGRQAAASGGRPWLTVDRHNGSRCARLKLVVIHHARCQCARQGRRAGAIDQTKTTSGAVRKQNAAPLPW